MTGGSGSEPKDVLDTLRVGRELRVAFKVLAELGPELLQRAYVDPLSGLLNSAALGDVLATGEVEEAQFCVTCLDLTGFKQSNDRYGHVAGDAALKLVGTTLLEIAKVDGVVPFRVGGDEFLILTRPNKFPKLRRWLRTLSWPRFQFQRRPAPFGASKGAALPKPDLFFKEIKDRADMACRASKMKDDQLVVWSASLRVPEVTERRFRCSACRAAVRVDVPSGGTRPQKLSCPCCRQYLK